MQVADGLPNTPDGPVVEVHPSLAIDLSWALLGAYSERLRARQPVVAALYDTHPDLGERVRNFWGDTDCFAELEILAWHAGALWTTEATELFEALDRACAGVPTDLALRSETAGDRQAFLRRLERLKRSPRLRRSYLALVREVFEGIPGWPAILAAETSAARALAPELVRTGRWPDLMDTVQCPQFATIVARLETESYPTVAVVPSALFGISMILDLPDTLLVGVPAAGGAAAARVRTEGLARRLRTLADPTRLAIMEYLASGPRGVGEVAQAFGLAQPTVSNHVKQLREAGILQAERTGNRLALAVDRDAVGSLLDDVRALGH